MRALCLVAGFAFGVAGIATAAENPAGTAILEDLRNFREYGSVLHIAAHPDDENTTFITAMAKGRHFRSAYLSVTRGDGGQNEIGPELDALLGLARTQELLAARRIDGGRQYFTRALDFGYSKTVDETMAFWGHDEVLGDVVRVIRTFKPDVIVNNFAAVQQPNQHGNHNASAILGLEAFKLAGDPKAYPEQLAEGLTVWQAKRILQGPGPTDLSGTDPVTGETFAAIAQRSRSMHHTQGFGINPVGAGRGAGPLAGGAPAAAAPRAGGAPPAGGPAGGGQARGGGGGRGGAATFNVLAGDPVEKDIMDGIDTTWARIPNGGTEIGKLADDAIAAFKVDDPAASVPALLALRTKLTPLPKETIIDEKRALLDKIIQNCLGLTVETTIPTAEVVPGEALKMKHTVSESSNVPVRWIGVRYPNAAATTSSNFSVAVASVPASRDESVILPDTTRVSQPYWLREQAKPGLFVLQDVDRKLIGMPENPPVFPVELMFDVGGQTLVVPTEPVQLTTNKAGADRKRKLDAISPVTVHFSSIVKILAPGATGPVDVELTANRANESGTLQLDLPVGWTATPASQNFKLGEMGSKSKYTFRLTAPAGINTSNLGAHVVVNGKSFNSDRYIIDYDHIPLQLMQPTALAKAVSLDLKIGNQKVAYLPGSGDDVAECLTAMGYTVTKITGADLTVEKLSKFDTVVLGVRAYNERTDFGAAGAKELYAWVDAGGTLISQYNRPNGLLTQPLAPYDLSIQGNAPALRVTDENSPVTFLAPDHRAVILPNRLTQQDFDGWVQERGAYFPSSWDTEHFKTILAMNDPGENPLTSSLLIAQYGKGTYVYTGLGFFRQLPKGVPGAYRLFANLVSIGK